MYLRNLVEWFLLQSTDLFRPKDKVNLIRALLDKKINPEKIQQKRKFVKAHFNIIDKKK